MLGNNMLGPLDQNEAALGDNTPFSTTVIAGDTFTTAFLARHMIMT